MAEDKNGEANAEPDPLENLTQQDLVVKVRELQESNGNYVERLMEARADRDKAIARIDELADLCESQRLFLIQTWGTTRVRRWITD